MSRPFFFAVVLSIVCGTASTIRAAESVEQSLELAFTSRIQPFLTQYCLACHNEKKQEGKLDLSGFSTIDEIVKQNGVWEIVLERLEAGEMPPEKAAAQPSSIERKGMVDWIKGLHEAEAGKNAGDPGPVLARRLSHSEFDYTIRDLTGVDIRPTKEFPVDPANESGFDNSGESLTMSPALLKKYLAATRFVADHVVLQPDGFTFAPHVAVTDTDRDKFCVKRIVDFYERHQVDYVDYFFAAWQYQHRVQLGKPAATLAEFAAIGNLSPKYLQTISNALTHPAQPGPLADLQAEWQKLPTDTEQADAARRGCEQLRDTVVKVRQTFDHKVEKLHVKGNSDGSQPLVLWWNRQQAIQRMSYQGDGKNPELDAARNQFCHIFPNAFFLSSRGHYADPNLGVGLRLLTAGFHLMQGYFRDDIPLRELILDDAGQRELDRLWQELNFITGVPMRQYKDFLFFERAESPRFIGGPDFDFARPEDKDSTSQAKLQRMSDAYIAKVRKNEATPEGIEAVEAYFANMSSDIRWIETTRLTAESTHLAALLRFAERASRRPLTEAERAELLTFYRRLRDEDSLNHEDAIRDCIASVLLSPHFCYRFDLVAEATGVQPLSDYALASRLSYFLWSSMPDDELLSLAAASKLHEPDVLIAQSRRMLRDPRVRGLAVEFGGNWLEFRRFEEHNSVDRERFPEFTNELRQAMYEEPIRFFLDVARQDRSVLEFLYADHTFVNPLLARHYGMTVSAMKADEWVRVNDASGRGRGGLLPMSVFLTNNSPGLRTSPVERGYWVVRRLLGEHIPAPPPEVPELPKDEAKLGELTLPQLLAKHREHQACAVCHQRFDAIGLVFEGFGPVGEQRDKDLGNHAIQAKAIFPDGSEGEGLPGLKHYLREHRQQDFEDNLCRKLLAYALGRSPMLSDRSALTEMRTRLKANGQRFSTIVEVLVTSPQFLNKRGFEQPSE